jgi:hypothetical protein
MPVKLNRRAISRKSIAVPCFPQKAMRDCVSVMAHSAVAHLHWTLQGVKHQVQCER